MTTGKYISATAAVFVIVGFFLPWFVIGEGLGLGLEATLSGYDLASGAAFLEQDPRLYVVPLAGLLTLGLVFAAARYLLSSTVTGIILIALALGSLFGIWLALEGIRSASGVDEVLPLLETLFGEPLVAALLDAAIAIGYGLVACVFGFVFVVVGAVIDMISARRLLQADYSTTPVESTIPTLGMGQMNPPQTGIPPGQLYANPWDPSYAQDQGPAGTGVVQQMPAGGGPATPRPAITTEVLHLQPKALAWLVMTDGIRAGHSFQLLESTSIGRDADNDIVLDDSALSGRHARIKLENGSFFLWDLASTNGTLFRAQGEGEWEQVYRQRLQDRDEIKVGRTALHFMTVHSGGEGGSGLEGIVLTPATTPAEAGTTPALEAVKSASEDDRHSDTERVASDAESSTHVLQPEGLESPVSADDDTIVLP